MSANSTINKDLKEERAKVTFEIEEFTKWYHGGIKQLQEKRFLENYFLSDPELQSDVDTSFLSHKEKYEEAVRRVVVILKRIEKFKSEGHNVDNIHNKIFGSMLLSNVFKEGHPLVTHIGMFGQALASLGTPEQHSVNYELVQFADSLVPSTEFESITNKAFHTVTQSIGQHTRFSVNRSTIAGSYEKKTSVLFPDIDAVVFLNHAKHQNPLTEEIDALMEILKIKANEFGIIPSSITKSSKTVKFQFYNGVEMNLLPAFQYSQNVYEQYKAVLERIKSYPENFYMYSSSLAQIQTQFLKVQPGSTNQLIRLQKIANIDSLKIAFLLDDASQWNLLQTDQELEDHKNVFSPLILQRSNFIIDPSNPFNDLFNPKNLTAKLVTQLKECAEEMLGRVELLDSNESNELKNVSTTISLDTGYPIVQLHIDKIFEPHGMSLSNKYQELPDEIVFHVDFKYKELSQSIDPKRPSFFVDNKEAKKVSKTIWSDLLFLIRGKARIVVKERTKKKGPEKQKRYVFANGIPDVATVDDVRDAIETFLQQNDFKFQNSSAKMEHEKCDVTLYVPYTCNDTNFALRFSMKWSKLGEENKVIEKLGEENKVLNGKNWCAKFAIASIFVGAITIVIIGGKPKFLCN